MAKRFLFIFVVVVSLAACKENPPAKETINDSPSEEQNICWSENKSFPVSLFKIDQPVIEEIFIWDGKVVVEEAAHEGENKIPFDFLDETDDTIKPLSIQGVSRIVKLSENMKRNLAVTENGGNYEVIELANGNKEVLASLGNVKRDDLGITANDENVFVVTTSGYVAIGKEIKLNEIGSSYEESRYGFRFVSATKTSLLLGYDAGEFGGGVYAVDLRQSVPQKTRRLPQLSNICAMQQDTDMAVWTMTCSADDGLYRIFDSDIKASSDLSIKQKNIGKFEAHMNIGPMDMGGMFVGDDGKIYFVVNDEGIFSYKNGKTKTLWKGDFHLHYKKPQYGIGSSSQGIVVKGKRIYVASNSLGILIFEERKENSYEFIKQAVFSENRHHQYLRIKP